RLVRKKKITSVLDLTAESSEVTALRRLNYLNIPLLDLTPPTPAQLTQAAGFVESRLPHGGGYIHCALGYARSAGAAAAYLCASGRAGSVPEAVSLIKAARPQAVLRQDMLAALASAFTTAGPAGSPPARARSRPESAPAHPEAAPHPGGSWRRRR